MRAVRRGEIEQYLKESQALERDHLVELVRSRRAAWRVATVASVLASLAIVAVLLLTPLKKAEAFVVRVDNATGEVSLVTAMKNAQTSYGEVVDKYFLNIYVLNRENYDWETIDSTYDATGLMSTPAVQSEYAAIYEGASARQKTLANQARVTVRVRSITPGGDGRTAVVRFSTQIKRSSGAAELEVNQIATIAYQYVKAPIAEKDRRVNPLGFQVTSYRVDPEVVGAP